ncbi:MAG: rhomboid family intramembrane serine protease [Victivallaceae bacterium]|nr:rhomboid family intramembrane serine protease [Victivallaceae bacterium]
MLSDRDYMNKGGRRTPRYVNQENPNMCIYILIAINAMVYFSVSRELDLFDKLALSSIGIKLHMYWQIITSMFMHGGFTHILINMWGLYLFGTLVAPHLKTVRFLTMYFISGLCGNFLWLAFNWESVAYVRKILNSQSVYALLNVVGVNAADLTVNVLGAGGIVSSIPFDNIIPVGLVGASGALFGVLIATAMLEPNKEFILLLFPVPMKAKTLVAIYAVVEIISAHSSVGNVAHLAHIGGLIGGYLYIRLFCRRLIIWDPVSALLRSKKFGGRKTSSKGWTVNTPPLNFKTKSKFDFENKDPETPVSQKELDYLLDKVSRHGINSLSEAEMATLRKAREQMRKR